MPMQFKQGHHHGKRANKGERPFEGRDGVVDNPPSDMNKKPAPDDDERSRVRLDKWLWAARFFKTRALAAEEIGLGRVAINGVPAKASREPRPGDLLSLRQGALTRTVQVLALSASRGPAVVAQALYAETPESIAVRQKAADTRRLAPEPAGSIEQGRPTKRDRRQLADWQRWSASIDDT
jgi:ribosome-associated heat shock protein Hsp15